MGALTRDTPQPLLPLGGRPFLEHLVWNLRRHGIVRLAFCVGYLADRIIGHFGDGRAFGVSIEYVVEQSPAGTGGALLLARPRPEEAFLVVNGDTLFDLNYLGLGLLPAEEGAEDAQALRPVPDASRYGAVRLEGRRILGCAEKAAAGGALVNGGRSGRPGL